MLVFWWEEVTGLCEVVCFGVSGGSLSADDWVCVLTWLLIWVRYPALGVPCNPESPRELSSTLARRLSQVQGHHPGCIPSGEGRLIKPTNFAWASKI